MKLRDVVKALNESVVVYHPGVYGDFTAAKASLTPSAVLNAAAEMYDKVKGKTILCGDSKVVDGWWIETHTLGCRNAGDDPEDEWENAHLEYLDDYSNDGKSVVVVPEDFIFISITPQVGNNAKPK